MTDLEYLAYELGKAKGRTIIRIKIETDDGDTRWLSISPARLEAVKVALTTGMERS